ncbi:phosphate ABC transporter substrate-binding protein PstS [Parafrigoribacterium mesophilum]|uniref:phosphate ABC transporter substrate-binding protein PstS n=1 Tax=Parafrigoribacterium mesophilum TaxID=433646 RepID=UPI0031FDDC82
MNIQRPHVRSITARVASTIAIAAVAAIALSSCASNESPAAAGTSAALTGTLNGSGASSQGSASDAWVAAFQTANPEVTVNYSPDGSGAGRKAFIAGGVQYAGSDSALSDEELGGSFAACAPDSAALDLPVYISPIAVIFNVAGVSKLNLDAATIAGIFKRAITKWNDPAIAALNPGAELPSAAITAVHRSDDSGTTKNFADYLHQVAPEVWDAKPADTFPYTAGEAAQGTSGVVDAVTNGVNTIGYADASRAGKLGVAALKVGDSFVRYSAEAAAAVVAGSPLATGRAANDIAITLDRKTTDASHYPLVLVSYLIACQQYPDAATAKLVKAYLGFVSGSAGQQQAADSAGSAPLSGGLAATVAAAVASIK